MVLVGGTGVSVFHQIEEEGFGDFGVEWFAARRSGTNIFKFCAVVGENFYPGKYENETLFPNVPVFTINQPTARVGFLVRNGSPRKIPGAELVLTFDTAS
ncbi:unnamed protein product [Gongylonema pulchrum]|uniref:DUF5110 domain-containing protein n=1 Tax=Gongylonema pulchrum TaxID=637853 RepID=A0A183DSE1_9BILA|nr:unnamed protein product [Gongylonema pulchrum]